MSEWIGKAIEALQSPRPAAAVFFACVILLALSRWALETLGVRQAVDSFRFWLLLGALISGGFLLFDGLRACARALSSAARMRKLPAQLKTLGSGEREQLKHWIDNGIRSGALEVSTGIGDSLVRKGIMSRGAIFPQSDQAVFFLEQWVIDYLAKHPDVIGESKRRIIPSAFRPTS
jgi:hypothetical protein